MKEKRKGAELRHLGEDCCFAASNSAHGFHSFYAEFFDDVDVDRVFVIKGGPGTGKSRFMREVSTYAAARGWQSRMIYCSSDADSLDGVILQKGVRRWALLDGTSPHVYEPKSPGVREELINLGEFWDSDRLVASKEEIERQNRIKQEGYRRAYRYLSAYGSILENYRSRILPHVRMQSVSDYARKLVGHIPEGEKFGAQTCVMESIGMSGRVAFDFFFCQATRLYLIEDCKKIASYLTESLYRLAIEKKQQVRVCRNPIIPEQIDGIFFLKSGIAFALRPTADIDLPHHRISMRRFLKMPELRTIKEASLFDERMMCAMLDGTLAEMKVVRAAHFALEEIYSASMDFERKEEFTKSFCNRWFDLKNS